MKDLEIMIRMEELEEQLKPLHELEREKQKLKDDCKHNIVALLAHPGCISADGVCIFCGKKFETNKELWNSQELIDIAEYYCVFAGDKDAMVSAVKEIYIDIVSQNEDVELTELSNMIKEKFKEVYYDVKVEIEKIFDTAGK